MSNRIHSKIIDEIPAQVYNAVGYDILLISKTNEYFAEDGKLQFIQGLSNVRIKEFL